MNTQVEPARHYIVLVVDDDENDAELMRQSLLRLDFEVDVFRVENGAECLSFLRRQGSYGNVPTPDLILLDLNMPVMSGSQVLEERSRDERLKRIPVVVLTAMESEAEVTAMYLLGCNAFVTKPPRLGQLKTLVQTIASFWFGAAVLPART